MNLRVAFIVGDNQTLHCGVKDYARSLARALTTLNIYAEVIAPRDWSARSVLHLRRDLRKSSFDILHVQYPSIGFRSSLVPHLFGFMDIAKATVVTLHEYSALPQVQRSSMHLFRWTAGKLLFATDYERLSYNKQFGNIGVPQITIPIGSNVPIANVSAARDLTIVYFGQIRPNKGLESYLELAERSTAVQKPFQFKVIGSVPGQHKAYMSSLRAKAPSAVEWSMDLEFSHIAEILACSFAAYLPFPDGASERRGSMLAALLNGLPVLSTVGPATPLGMLQVIVPTANPQHALSTLDELVACPERLRQIGAESRRYAGRFSWREIANRHHEIYHQLLYRKLSRPQEPTRPELPPLARTLDVQPEAESHHQQTFIQENIS